MPVRRILKSFVLRSVEPTLREWVDPIRRETEELRTAIQRPAVDDALSARLAAVEEESVQLKKKLSMAMGAIQAATAQIVQLKQEAEQAQNLARQAMQRATSAQATAEAASDGIHEIEAPTETTSRADGKPESDRCQVEGCTSRAKTQGLCNKHYKQFANGTLVRP